MDAARFWDLALSDTVGARSGEIGGEQDSEESRGESEPHIYNCPCSSKNH